MRKSYFIPRNPGESVYVYGTPRDSSVVFCPRRFHQLRVWSYRYRDSLINGSSAGFKDFFKKLRDTIKREEKKEAPADAKPTETEASKPTETAAAEPAAAPAEPAAPAEGKKMRCTLANIWRKFVGNFDAAETPAEAPKAEEAAPEAAAAPAEPAAPAEGEAPAPTQ